MKRRLAFTLGILSLLPCVIEAQSQTDAIPFRRSSLYTFIVKTDKDSVRVDKAVEGSGNVILDVAGSLAAKKEATAEDSIPKSELILNVFTAIPIPDQFNDHNLPVRVMDFDLIPVTKEEIDEANRETVGEKKTSGFGRFMKATGEASLSAVSSGTISVDTLPNINTQLPAVLKKFIASENIPARLVGKWYNYTGEKRPHPFLSNVDVYYDMSLIQERGLYNASAEDKATVSGAEQGEYILKDAGKSLIPNTFVMALYLQYLRTEETLAKAQGVATGVSGVVGGVFGKGAGDLALAGTQVAGAIAGIAAGSGYSVQATSYLYQLVWDDEKRMQFESYLDKPIEELIASGICELQFVGKDKKSAIIRSSRFSKKPESDLVKRATARAIDAVIAKLQNEYDVFKTKAKIAKIDEENGWVYAAIGLKEGIEKGDVYAVLEATYDKATEEVSFKKVGTVKAEGKQIWDNRYEADEEIAEDLESGEIKEKPTLTATAFSGRVKNLHTGMYLQLEKKK
ncbi:MAG: hypothetical protein LBQ78_05575 [Tannerellaceae bacterium]|nr:hypothetical protein [Tannerellaceae bacterium]